MKFKIVFETINKERFNKYRSVNTLGEAWDVAEAIKKDYNGLHKDKVMVVGVYKNH